MKRPNITPGPWYAMQTSAGTYAVTATIPASSCREAVVRETGGATIAEEYANARAIAAVPETHKALERALCTLERLAPSLESRDVETVEILRSALIAAGYQF